MADIVILPDHEAVAQAAAERWKAIASQMVEERGEFSVALSGGDTPRKLYELLAQDPLRETLPWANTHIFWGDERRVPHNDPRSNYRMAREALLDHVPIPANQIHPMPVTGLSRRDAADYEATLRRHFQFERRGFPTFDLILLGVGEDGHTASIFPGTRAVSDLSRVVLVYEVPQLREQRITLSLSVLNQARHMLVMAVGESKAQIIATVLESAYVPSTYPIQAVKPQHGTLTWLLDAAAASQLSSPPSG